MQEGGNMKLEAMNISFQYDNGNRKILNNVSISLESGADSSQRFWKDDLLQDTGWL